MTHAPRRLIGHAELALKLLSWNPVAGRGEQEHRVEPLVKRRARALHDRAHSRMQLMFAVLADIGALARHTVEVTVNAALRAVQFRTAVAFDHNALQARLIIRELLLKFVKRGHGDRLCSECRNRRLLCQGDNCG